MPNISQRHHYLPIFFIKGFIEPSTKLWVYDKSADKILPEPKSPKSIFFEWNKNNVTIDGQEIDFLETKLYKYIDDFLAKEFHAIQRSPLNNVEQQNFINHIILMIAITFYRTPGTQEWTNELTEKNLQQPLPKHYEELINKIFNLALSDTDTKKMIDCFAPFINFFTTDKNLLRGKGYYKVIETEKPCFILSDNPIIYETLPNNFHEITNSLIFPLTSNRIYYGLRGNDYSFNIDILKRLNILLTVQAKKYFGSESKDFLEQLVNAYRIIKPVQQNLLDMTKELFMMVNK